jgi:hypothetical protein
VEKEVLVTTIQNTEKDKVGVSEATFKPYFIVTEKDKNERQDARGSFIRVYDRKWNDKVKITVQPQYGNYVFNKWTDVMGKALAGSRGNQISVGMRDDQIICAQFIAMDDVKTKTAKVVSAIPMASAFTNKLQLKQNRLRLTP